MSRRVVDPLEKLRCQRSETELLYAALNFLGLMKIPAARNNRGAVRVPETDRGKERYIEYGLWDGASDIVALLPPTGRALFIETKKWGEKPRPNQASFGEMVTAAGCLYWPIHSVEELKERLEALRRG